MKWTKATKLMSKYAICPECGNEYIGNGEGGVEITETMFRRTCKCRFEVVVKEQEE